MSKPNFCGINDWKVLFCSMVAALFLEDLTPSRLLCCQNVHLDVRFYCFAKKQKNSATCSILSYLFILYNKPELCIQRVTRVCLIFKEFDCK